MVQILPEVPSFGQSLARNLSSGLSQGVNLGLQHSLALKQIQAKESEKRKRNESLLESFGIKNSGEKLAEASGKFQKLSPEQKAMLALTNPSAFKAYEALESGMKGEEEKAKSHEDLSMVVNQMANTLKGGRLGYTPKRLINARGRRDAQYFDSLGVQLESIAKDMVSKGVLARDRFAYLLSNLPSSKNTDATNAGAIEAWSDELGIPRPEGLEKFYEKKSKAKKSAKMPTRAFKDAEGNVYDIPHDLAEKAAFEGLSPL